MIAQTFRELFLAVGHLRSIPDWSVAFATVPVLVLLNHFFFGLYPDLGPVGISAVAAGFGLLLVLVLAVGRPTSGYKVAAQLAFVAMAVGFGIGLHTAYGPRDATVVLLALSDETVPLMRDGAEEFTRVVEAATTTDDLAVYGFGVAVGDSPCSSDFLPLKEFSDSAKDLPGRLDDLSREQPTGPNIQAVALSAIAALQGKSGVQEIVIITGPLSTSCPGPVRLILDYAASERDVRFHLSVIAIGAVAQGDGEALARFADQNAYFHVADAAAVPSALRAILGIPAPSRPRPYDRYAQ